MAQRASLKSPSCGLLLYTPLGYTAVHSNFARGPCIPCIPLYTRSRVYSIKSLLLMQLRPNHHLAQYPAKTRSAAKHLAVYPRPYLGRGIQALGAFSWLGIDGQESAK